MNILITGISRGIGLECIKLLSANPAHTIIAVSRNTQVVENLNMGNIHVLQADITIPGDVEKIVHYAGTIFSQLDVLINNAGALMNRAFTAYTQAEARHVFDVNFFAPAHLIQSLLPMMQAGSHVVNIGSMGGYLGSVKFPGLAYYSASKAALANLTECLAEELKETGIRVNCLALGSAQTEMLAEAFPGYQSPVTAAQMAVFITDFALKGGMLFNGKVLPVSVTTP